MIESLLGIKLWFKIFLNLGKKVPNTRSSDVI